VNITDATADEIKMSVFKFFSVKKMVKKEACSEYV